MHITTTIIGNEVNSLLHRLTQQDVDHGGILDQVHGKVGRGHSTSGWTQGGGIAVYVALLGGEVVVYGSTYLDVWSGSWIYGRGRWMRGSGSWMYVWVLDVQVGAGCAGVGAGFIGEGVGCEEVGVGRTDECWVYGLELDAREFELDVWMCAGCMDGCWMYG